MKALLLVAHGSRRQRSNDEVIELAEKLKTECAQHYDIVQAAFLELADTLIADGIENCVNDGATHITVLPYFLNSGRHVTEDIPHDVDSTRARFHDVHIQIAQHIGASAAMIDMLKTAAVPKT
ncbi:CbiX/SirB N-terminal domain-containing protein [uncultured Methylophaga sp.]|uniref:sirohydrochlorin chelatase n=1 Tax=uncultured Methylophaga sp. TaxID=285271 RepID=UPI002621F4FA|nr:CbiX/SirB N-terminal domain-containing protein [uncultured Methylophaga sp.]